MLPMYTRLLTWLEQLESDKHSSSLGPLISYKENKLLWIRPLLLVFLIFLLWHLTKKIQVRHYRFQGGGAERGQPDPVVAAPQLRDVEHVRGNGVRRKRRRSAQNASPAGAARPVGQEQEFEFWRQNDDDAVRRRHPGVDVMKLFCP